MKKKDSAPLAAVVIPKQKHPQIGISFSFYYYLSQNDIFNFGSNMTHPVE